MYGEDKVVGVVDAGPQGQRLTYTLRNWTSLLPPLVKAKADQAAQEVEAFALKDPGVSGERKREREKELRRARRVSLPVRFPSIASGRSSIKSRPTRATSGRRTTSTTSRRRSFAAGKEVKCVGTWVN